MNESEPPLWLNVFNFLFRLPRELMSLLFSIHPAEDGLQKNLTGSVGDRCLRTVDLLSG
jgi:hypothetical protein